jgi:hypothetical protein
MPESVKRTAALFLPKVRARLRSRRDPVVERIRAAEEESRLFDVRGLVVVIFAAVIEVIASGSEGPNNMVGVPVALLGLLLISWRSIVRVGPLYFLAFTTSFVDYKMTQFARIDIGGVPLSVVDLALLATFATLLVPHPARSAPLPVAGMRRVLFATVLFFACFFPSFLIGLFHNPPYDVVRAFRPIIFIPVAFIATVRKIAPRQNYKLLIQTLYLGGFYGLAVIIFARARRLSESHTFPEVRDFGYLNAGAEFAFVLAAVFIVCSQSLYRRRIVTWAAFAFLLVGAMFSLTLTFYAFVVLVPIIALVVAPLPRVRKVTIVSVAAGAILFALLLVPATQMDEAGGIKELTRHVISQYANLQSSPHLASRIVSWQGAFDLVPGAKLLTGIGLGTRVWLYTEYGVFVAGEPTVSSYLIDAGLVGVFAVLWLQVTFVIVAYRRIRTSRRAYLTALRSALTVFGIVTIVNSFLHNNFMTAQLSAMYAIIMALAIRVDPTDSTDPEPQRANARPVARLKRRAASVVPLAAGR